MAVYFLKGGVSLEKEATTLVGVDINYRKNYKHLEVLKRLQSSRWCHCYRLRGAIWPRFTVA